MFKKIINTFSFVKIIERKDASWVHHTLGFLKKYWIYILLVILSIVIFRDKLDWSQILDPKYWIDKKLDLPFKNTSKNKKEEKNPIKIPSSSLKDLFKNDFPMFMKESGVENFEFQNGEKFNIKWQIYFDYETQSKFIGYYIASNPHTLEICVGLVDHYKDMFNLSDGLRVEMQSPVLQPVEKSELKFSGRVFIYHEDPLFESKKTELRELYKNHGESIQFRGSEYQWEKTKLDLK